MPDIRIRHLSIEAIWGLADKQLMADHTLIFILGYSSMGYNNWSKLKSNPMNILLLIYSVGYSH